ncbi:helix-turn-helix transcriptional regulator [Aeromicrobium halocynthiae]|uniref:Helix-turn-helix transcriptional regulator n=1 Tax=Aeromicrobium halocynthiae TaxID=560557 RepID=A0ABN2W7H8_9ACTN
MPLHRLAEAASVLGVSDDTLRRWQTQGRFTAVDAGGRLGIDGRDLARLAVETASEGRAAPSQASVRNRLRGVVTAITRDTVMAQVELSCGPYRIVSLVSSEAVDDLGLEVGSLAWASVKSTNVALEVGP